ncbi:hypothetical protein PN497_25025 [Sphaerospermopsis kisseleviana CS-549]|uniref:Uncharacterized protein n=1 Tax=Sphaerospermopsis kisseleviana CS-549 TaxID=3021783 RepID=A0ABT4ZZA3_9CYAN|nr:hypothetical protein [Sphaerospermopsis kisseleviana]MDB9444589.1 hypothetical protein [Sphaerospermopsis kisseleviana CS-549]
MTLSKFLTTLGITTTLAVSSIVGLSNTKQVQAQAKSPYLILANTNIASLVISSTDDIRGWSWNGTTASYIAVNADGGNTLYVRSFDGQKFGSVRSSQSISSTDDIRGWSWNGTTASYVVTNADGGSTLYIRPFNGQKFGPVRSSQSISSTDDIRGWSWNGTTASYVATNADGGSTLYIRPFNGQTL